MGKNNKQVRGPKSLVATSKAPREAILDLLGELKHPTWRMRRMRFDGPFSWNAVDPRSFQELRDRLGNLETMTWQQIDSSTGSHFLSSEKLSDAAVGEIRRLRLEEYVDLVYSLRINGVKRVIGIRDRGILEVIWWDPEHGFCPSILKYT